PHPLYIRPKETNPRTARATAMSAERPCRLDVTIAAAAAPSAQLRDPWRSLTVFRSTRARATLQIRSRPDLDTLFLTVECRASATTISVIRGAGLPLSREQWITFAAYRHEEECE